MSGLNEENTGAEIAVIGMSARFPGAGNIDEYLDNLKNGVESISFLSNEELQESGIDADLISNPEYVNAKGGIIEDKACFDASFFDYTPLEAEIMDPQIRLFHECAWRTFENAGYDPHLYDGLIGIYAGGTSSSYWEGLTFLSGKNDQLGRFAAGQLSNKDFLCTRIAHRLNLKGPAIAVQTACSTSLVAIHLACQSILDGECHMALAGGVAISYEDYTGYLYQEGMIMSPDGHCRAFDAGSNGTIGGNGIGIVLLKSLEDALADGDFIHAVIKGSAVNNDGLRKAAYTAPGPAGQAAVIRTALQVAEVEPESIGYVEAHGTGTTLGDPVEIDALTRAYNTDKKQFCGIGSVKTN
ncbi:MAG: polyketide synthase, partial [bacterium]|nr:polyketide synthase [bacterium]